VTVASLIRGWRKPADEEATELDKDRPRLGIGPLAMLLSGSFSDSQKIEKEEIKVEGWGHWLVKRPSANTICLCPQATICPPTSPSGETPKRPLARQTSRPHR